MVTRTQFALDLMRDRAVDVEHLTELLASELGIDARLVSSFLSLTAAPGGAVNCAVGSVASDFDIDSLVDALEHEASLFALFVVGTIGLSGDEQVSLSDLREARAELEKGLANAPRPPADIRSTPEASRVAQLLSAGTAAALIGRSSSGKTVLAQYVSETWSQNGGSVLWLNLARPHQKGIALLAAVLSVSGESGRRLLVVADDVQGAPLVASSLFASWREILPRAHILAAGWPDGQAIVEMLVPGSSIVRLDGARTARHIVQSLPVEWEEREKALALADGDALVADLIVQHYSISRELCSEQQLSSLAYARVVGNYVLDEAGRHALYTSACLSTFEIEVDPQFLSAEDRSATLHLVEGGVLKTRVPFVYLGHRSLARLVANFLRSHTEFAGRAPVAVAVRYLQAAGPAQIKQTLDRLDLVAVSGSEDQFGASFLAESWNDLRTLVGYLSRQVERDPTWGDNVASAVFAADAFSALGIVTDWARTADYVRGRWAVAETSDLPTSASITAESDDFVAIGAAMAEEDAMGDQSSPEAADVDLDRFHRTWVLGLLLGFEGTAIVSDPDRRSGLIRMAGQTQLPSGAFYPERVPWVTARVLVGLAAVGATVETSDVAARAANWLRTKAPAGPYRFGIWRPGTGRWNTELQTTAIVLLALGRVGISPADPVVRRGTSYLRDARAEWNIPGKEIDCAQAVEAALVLGGGWRDFSGEIRGLCAWAKDLNSWANIEAKASDLQDESSKVSAVAGSLIGIIWATVQQELPILFEGVGRVSDSVDPAPSSDSGGPDAESGRMLRSVAARLQERCEEHVRDREAVVTRRSGSPEVVRSLAVWRRRRLDLVAISAKLSSDPISDDDMAVLREKLNSLGSEILADAWEQLT